MTDGKAKKHVPRKNQDHMMLYISSTYRRLARTKNLLDESGVEYSFKYAEHLRGDEKEQDILKVKIWTLAVLS